MSEDDRSVISILDRFKKADTAVTPVTIVGKDEAWARTKESCAHQTYRVDEKLPKVTCGQCGEVLDPYYALRLVGAYFEKRDHRWEAIRDQEKQSAQYAAAELHRVREWQTRQHGIAEGSYCTRDRRYVVQHTPKGWTVTWDGTVIRVTGTLSTAKTFIRDHVRTNWGKEPARSLAQASAAKRVTDEGQGSQS
jgi:hypothetical protein